MAIRYHYPAKAVAGGTNYQIREVWYNDAELYTFKKSIGSPNITGECDLGDRIDDCVLPAFHWTENPQPAYEITRQSQTTGTRTVEYDFFCIFFAVPVADPCPAWIIAPEDSRVRILYTAEEVFIYVQSFFEGSMGCDFPGPPSITDPGEIRVFQKANRIASVPSESTGNDFVLDLNTDWSIAEAEAEWDMMSEGSLEFPAVVKDKRNGMFAFATGTLTWLSDSGSWGPFSGTSRIHCNDPQFPGVDQNINSGVQTGFSIKWEITPPKVQVQYKDEDFWTDVSEASIKEVVEL